MPNPTHEELVRVALRSFAVLVDKWELTPRESAALLGTAATKSDRSGDEMLDRISFMLGIYRALHILFADSAQADAWIRKQNLAFGCSALSVMQRDAQGLATVRAYLDSKLV